MAITATYVSATSFTVAGDLSSEIVTGMRIKAYCGVDGTRYGTVTTSVYTALTTVALSLDSGVLTSNLVSVLHGNDKPSSLAEHGHTGQADGGALSGFVKADCSVPFTGGHIPASGAYTGFKFTETGAATNAGKWIYQIDNNQASLLAVNDAENVFNSVWTADRSGTTPTYFTVTPTIVASGGVSTSTINSQDISSGLVTEVKSLPGGECRLTLVSTNLKLSRYNGKRLIIDDVVQIIPSAGVTLAATGTTASTLYYIYAYMSSGTMTLEYSTTSSAIDSRNGIMTKSGDTTRTMVGMAYPVAGPAWADSATQRFVLSYFNRRRLDLMLQPVPSGASISSSSYVDINSSVKLEYISWGEGNTLFYHVEQNFNGTGTNSFRSVLYVDGNAYWDTEVFSSCATGNYSSAHAMTSNFLTGVGYHSVKLYCASMSGNATSVLYSTRIGGWIDG